MKLQISKELQNNLCTELNINKKYLKKMRIFNNLTNIQVNVYKRRKVYTLFYNKDNNFYKELDKIIKEQMKSRLKQMIKS
ncbi:hypothetical protein SH1V18_47730 [Vallitalea longa]|uniref:Uncharacterized protein n=1 Tax=Vallitalea longa TaxID=2936439 RepID=A0A9W5YJ47_9FIRM|nr:hypothetical protein [Vallitalea longa]GKX32293.1 hypothetical protein SH1V18_47730 [Vallitalea longa]